MADHAHLQYKGWRSTRLQLGLLVSLAVSAGYVWGDVVAQQWIDFLEWVLTTVILSEVGTKATIAYRDTKGPAA